MGVDLRSGTLQAVYLLETPLDPAQVAEVLAGEQSSGTFVRVAGETDDLRARSRATVDHIEELAPASAPSLPNALLERRGQPGPWRRARVTVSFPLANIGANLTTIAATVAGNLYDLGETTGVRLEKVHITPDFRIATRISLPPARDCSMGELPKSKSSPGFSGQ